MLDEQLIAAERDDRRGRETEAARPAAAADGEEEEQRRAQPQEVLHGDHKDQVRGDPVQQPQEHRIPDHPYGVAPQPRQRSDGAVEVDPAVGVARDRRTPDQQEVDPQEQSRADQGGQEEEHPITRHPSERSSHPGAPHTAPRLRGGERPGTDGHASPAQTALCPCLPA